MNQPLEDPENKEYFLMLPIKVQTTLFRKYYFPHFLEVFKDNFRIKNPQGQNYTWKDVIYRDFMMQFLRDLDPWHVHSESIIFDELDDINEVIFIRKGIVEIGYEMNKKKKFVVRYEDKVTIGAFNCTFNMRIIFVYKAKTDCEGYTINKSNWIKLLNENKEIGDLIKKNVELDYFMNIKSKVEKVKK